MQEADLRRIYETCRRYVQDVSADGLTSADDVSSFWRTELDGAQRISCPDYEQMLAMRDGATYPMGDAHAEADVATKQRNAHAAYAAVRSAVPREFLLALREPPVGTPSLFDVDGLSVTASGLINALTTYRIVEQMRSCGSIRGLNVLEIGAGYGHVASYLLNLLPIERYVVCDLPENLLLSSFYLQATFPDRTAHFLRPDDGDRHSQFVFLVPRCLPHLSGTFDLIINSYSFQEMSRASVNEYFDFARRRLSPAGVLYSLNAHGKDGIGRASEYPLAGFRMVGLRAVRPVPHHFVFATNPYELVLSPDASAPAFDEARRARFDAICDSFQLGLAADVSDLADRFVADRLKPPESVWLGNVGRCLDANGAAEKYRSIADAERVLILPDVTAYLRAAIGFASGDVAGARPHLARASEHLRSDYARAQASLMLAWDCRRRNDADGCRRYRSRTLASLGHLEEELDRWIDGEELPARIAGQIRLQRRHTASDHIRRIGARLRRRLSG